VYESLENTTAVQLRIPLFWATTLRQRLTGFRRFGAKYCPYLQGSKRLQLRPLKMIAICCFETTGSNYFLKQRHIPKEGILQWEIGFQIIGKVNRYKFDIHIEKG
jgi:hypothetical protein